MIPVIAFLISAAVVVFAGTRLSRHGDLIAERTRLGEAFVGTILVAAATSLPELATTSFAVAQGSVRLAVGDLFGTLMVNMAALAVAVTVIGGANIFRAAPDETAVSATIAIGLCAIAAAGTVVAGASAPLGIGWAPIVIVVTYLGGVWVLRMARRSRRKGGEGDGGAGGGPSLRPVLLRFGAASVAIVIAAYVLALSARQIAEMFGLAESFVGAALVGVVTSLPEATVAFAAFLRGAHGIGLGALFGSNAFDVVILFPLDALQGPGPILAEVDAAAQVSVLFAMLLMSMAVVGIVAPGARRIRGVEPVAVAMIVMYVVGLFLTYRAGL